MSPSTAAWSNDAKRLKELKGRIGRPKKMEANQAIDIDMLREVATGEFWPRT